VVTLEQPARYFGSAMRLRSVKRIFSQHTMVEL